MKVDDTKTYRQVTEIEYQDPLQRDIDTMNRWSKTLLNFHPDKKPLRVGNKDEEYQYSLASQKLACVDDEKDLEVTMYSKMKFSTRTKNKVNRTTQEWEYYGGPFHT